LDVIIIHFYTKSWFFFLNRQKWVRFRRILSR